MEEKTYMYLLAIKGFDTFTGEIVNSSQYGLDVTLKVKFSFGRRWKFWFGELLFRFIYDNANHYDLWLA